MPDDQQHNAFNESLQDRGWRQMSGRLDREMPVSGGSRPNIPILAVIASLFLLAGGYWLLRPDEPVGKSVSALPDIPLKTIGVQQGVETDNQLDGILDRDALTQPPVGENLAIAKKNEKDLMQEGSPQGIKKWSVPAVESVGIRTEIPRIVPLQDTESDDLSMKVFSTSMADNSKRLIASLPNRPLMALQHSTQRSSLDREQTKPPFDNSIWVNIGARMGSRFSTDGYTVGIGHQWFRNRWTLDLGGHFSMIDYRAFRDGIIHGIETDQRVTIKKFAFEEGAYRSYSDVMLMAGKTNFAGISATVGRGLYSGLYVSAGTSLHRIIGGESEDIIITTESLGEEDDEVVPVNAKTLVDQEVLNPWMWKASAGVTWHFTPSWAMTVRYEQSLNDLLEENTIAPDERANFYWIEVGMKFRLIRF